MNNHRFKRNPIGALAIGLITLSFVGCQSLQVKDPGELAIENHAFISLWDTYNHCVTGSNTQEMQRNLEILHSAPKPISLDDSPIPIPEFLKKLSSTRNSRLAVDPRAMAAACSIQLGEVARQSADWDTAFRAFQAIVKNYPEPQYDFYVSKANQAIEQFSSALPVSLSSYNSPVR